MMLSFTRKIRIQILNQKTQVRNASVLVTKPLASAPRESPTAVAVFSGFGLQHQGSLEVISAVKEICVQQGFAIASVHASDIVTSLDDEVDSIHSAIMKAGLSIPPVAIASAHNAVLLQKYLESYPFAACILLGPLPPSPGRVLKRKGSTYLSMVGTEARLLSLLCEHGAEVNLEPSPVPMLVIAPVGLPRESEWQSAPPWLSAEDVEETLAYHGLDGEDEESVYWVPPPPGHSPSTVLAFLWGIEGGKREGEQAVAALVANRVASWIQARF